MRSVRSICLTAPQQPDASAWATVPRREGELRVGIRASLQSPRLHAVVVRCGNAAGGMPAPLRVAETGLSVAVLSKNFSAQPRTIAIRCDIGAALATMPM